MGRKNKISIELKLKAVKEYLDGETSIKKTSCKYGVSTTSFRGWLRKRKSENEMSELEKLKSQNKLLEAENKRKQMEIDFLKKLDEIERRRY